MDVTWLICCALVAPLYPVMRISAAFEVRQGARSSMSPTPREFSVPRRTALALVSRAREASSSPRAEWLGPRRRPPAVEHQRDASRRCRRAQPARLEYPLHTKAGGSLRYGIAAEIVTLGFNQSNDFEVLQGMYDPLLTYDDNLQPVAHLARKAGSRAATSSRSNSISAKV